ncbi:MAG: ribonuclease T2 [Rubellimicrobium sp.]|nr:ribonuclease T2 [Rubellimicrobium sp.]
MTRSFSRPAIVIAAVFLALAIALVPAGPSRALDGHEAGDFDYYVMALSWQPTWCTLEGDARGSDRCDGRERIGWVLHGLWPQYEWGSPEDCPTAQAPPGRRITGAMADIMGAPGLVRYQWFRHGSCSGLSAEAYFAAALRAWQQVERPALLEGLDREVLLPATLIEEAFLRVNPGIGRDSLTVTCRSGMIQEVRICLTRDLEPRRCGPDTIRDCALQDALFQPVRVGP